MKLQNYIRIIAVYLSLSLRGCKSNELSINKFEHISPLEQRMDALKEVVERLLVESSAKDTKINDLASKAGDIKTMMELKVEDMETLLESKTQKIIIQLLFLHLKLFVH